MKLGWFLLGAAAGALVVVAAAPPNLEGCCRNLADAARDAIAEKTPWPDAVAKWLDRTGLTERLPKLIEIFK